MYVSPSVTKNGKINFFFISIFNFFFFFKKREFLAGGGPEGEGERKS